MPVINFKYIYKAKYLCYILTSMAILQDYKINIGTQNMAEDERLLNLAVENKLKEPILRLYGWHPACVSLGRNQTDESINKDFCKENGIDIVRRLTGGRALLHDKELTYSFICPTSFLNCSNSVILSYKEISGALIEGLKLLDVDLSFPNDKKPNAKFDYCMSISTGADLSYQNKKLIGSAQYRKQGYILQHGSVLLDYDALKIETIFNEKVDKNSITSLKEINPKIELKELSSAIIEGFEKYFNLKFQ